MVDPELFVTTRTVARHRCIKGTYVLLGHREQQSLDEVVLDAALELRLDVAVVCEGCLRTLDAGQAVAHSDGAEEAEHRTEEPFGLDLVACKGFVEHLEGADGSVVVAEKRFVATYLREADVAFAVGEGV